MTLSENEIKKINEEHIWGVDKWNRMCAGLASCLKKYEDDIIYIEIENTEKVRPSNFETAESIVQSWLGGVSELRQAKGWVVCFYKTNASTGFLIGFNDLENKDIVASIVNQVKVEKELQLVGIFSGVFN